MAAEGGVKLPGVGHVSKRWVVTVGVASLGSIAWFAYKRKQGAAAAAVPAATDTTGQIDPLTGDIAGSAQDQTDLASLQSGGSGSGMSGASGGYYAGSGALGTSGVTPPVPDTGGFTTNGQWAQQAEADLGGIGIDQVALAAALGHYLTGSPLSTAEQSMVDQAIAEEGYPPVAGPSGYPPAMHASPTGGGGGGGGGWKFPAPGGLTAFSVSSTGYRLSWHPVTGPSGQHPSGYTVATYASNGTLVDQFTVAGTSTSEYDRGGKGLPKGTYHTNVWANGGPVAPAHATVTVTVTK